MPAPATFDYALLRVVPRVERQEFINAGVVVFCLEKRYLDARIHLDPARLKALWPEADPDLVREHLVHWLTAPRSTIIQPSPVHTGVCDNTGGVLDRLVKQFLSV